MTNTHSAAALVDEFLPAFDVSDSVAVVVQADVAGTWEALMDVDFMEVGRRRPLLGGLGVLRMLPDLAAQLLRGERAATPARLGLREITQAPPDEGGWTLLGERPAQEIALGLVGRFWRPVIAFAPVSKEQFRSFAEPGYAKTVYSLSIRELAPGQSLLCATMRTATTDERARRWFRRYWAAGIGSGAHLLVGGLLELVREQAELGNGADHADGTEGGESEPSTAVREPVGAR